MGETIKRAKVLVKSNWNRMNLLTVLTVIGVFAGVSLGIILRVSRKEEGWSQREQIYVKFAGEIFLRMLKALSLPLIISSLIAAIGSLDLSSSGRIGTKAFTYYMVTSILAVVLGITLVISIHPGKKEDVNIRHLKSINVTTADTLMDLARNMFPPNLFEATMNQYQTFLTMPTIDPTKNQTLPPIHKWQMGLRSERGTNFLGLVVFSTVLGASICKMGQNGKPLLDFFRTLSEAMMIITHWVVWMLPLGVCFLIAAQLLAAESILQLFNKLGWFLLTVLLGLGIHGFILLPLIYSAITRKLPFTFMRNTTQALVTAFGTASSSATLPITLHCLENKNGVDPRVSRFLAPIGATINMDGTALYEAVAAIFIAQIHGLTLSFGDIVTISITATAASIGAAGIPHAGLVTMVMVLKSVGLPVEYIAYIIPLDWILDRCRTTVNVLGDSIGAGVVDRMSKSELEVMPDKSFETERTRFQKGRSRNSENVGVSFEESC